MKRILINSTHAEETRVALCNDKTLYDFDLENRTREQKKANIYKGHVTRVEPSLEAVFVEYGSQRQGFLSIREIAKEYLKGDPKNCKNIKEIISEGDELLVQVEKEERGNKGAALSTFISLAGRYLVLMPNNASGGGISRQISGSVRDEMKRMLAKLQMPKGMSVIIRTAGIGHTQEDLQFDLNHLLDIWKNINHVAQTKASPCLAHKEAGVVTRAVRDYLRDDIAEVWIDHEQAYNEAYNFVQAVMPSHVDKLRKYIDLEPMFTRFGVEQQIETAYMREVKLPSGGSIVIDQTEALVSIDINSAKATRGADVESTAHNTNLEAADEIARQLRLRDMGGLIVIDFIDMLNEQHRKDVEDRIKSAVTHDRARIQFASISRFGLLEMSRQRLRPSLEEATGYVCPRCHGTGMIRDLRSLSLSIMRRVEKIAFKEGRGEVQVEVPIEIGAFLLNEKRDSLVFLEQDSGARITILPHAHLETPQYNIVFNKTGFSPSSYQRVTNKHEEETQDLGYETDWHSEHKEHTLVTNGQRPNRTNANAPQNRGHKHNKNHNPNQNRAKQRPYAKHAQQNAQGTQQVQAQVAAPKQSAWLSNLFTSPVQAQTSDAMSSQDAAAAIEAQVNSGAVSRGIEGNVDFAAREQQAEHKPTHKKHKHPHKPRKPREENRNAKPQKEQSKDRKKHEELPKRDAGSKRASRGERQRGKPVVVQDEAVQTQNNGAELAQTQQHSGQQQQKETVKGVQVNVIETENAAKPVEHVHVDVEQKSVQQKEKHNAKQHKQAKAKPAQKQQKSVAKQLEPKAQAIEVVKTPANTWGRAKNDPRNSKDVKVTGTVAEFIITQFGEEAANIVQSKGLVGAFVEALASSKVEYTTLVSLADDFVAAYRASIIAVAQSALAAGTSDATAPAPSFRATNDPRGQIEGHTQVPEHLQSKSVLVAEAVQEEATTPEEVESTQATEQVSESVVEEVVNTDNAQQQDLFAEGVAEAANQSQDDEVTTEEVTVSEVVDTKPKQGLGIPSNVTTGNFIYYVFGANAPSLITEESLETAFILAVNMHKASPAVFVDEDLDDEAEQLEEKPAPKKRGRPRKKPAEKTVASKLASDKKPAKKKPVNRQRRTSKKATASKVVIEKKTDS